MRREEGKEAHRRSFSFQHFHSAGWNQWRRRRVSVRAESPQTNSLSQLAAKV